MLWNKQTKLNLRTLVVMAVILLGFGCTIAAGEVIYVDADASVGGNGQTWGTAYKYLQDALYDAVTDDEIWVAEGTYKPDEDEAANVTPNDRTETFQLINGVGIYGGFAGGETTLDERDWQTNETILSGDLNGDDVGFTNNGENSYHVVTGGGTDDTAILDGFTIAAGNADSSYPYDRGGGMFNSSGSPTVTNCTFSGNSADFGGGMNNYSNSNPTVTNCTFSGNSADNGGGMHNSYNSPMVTNCTFSGNSALSGGGMFNYSSSPTVTNCTFGGNSAGSNGGGMYNYEHSSPTVTNCTFSGNSASYGGGMWNGNDSNPTVTNCTFSGDSATWDGGGMYNDWSDPMVTNCIFWGNTAPSGAQIYNDGTSTPTVSYCDVQGGYSGTGNIPDDPLFVDADGPDNIVGTEDDNLRLSAGSPCIDAGDNTAVPGGVTTDLDGNPRFFDDLFTTDTGNGTPPIVDMGAYEYQPPPPPPIIFVDVDATGGANNGTSWSDAYLYLQDALADANSNPDVNEIWVAGGVYKPDANSANPGSDDRTATFQLINVVGIYGGLAGNEDPCTFDLADRDLVANETILSGDIGTPDVNTDNSYHVVMSGGMVDETAVLDGFTITAGNADYTGDEPYPDDCGGGMFNWGSPTVANCIFTGNWALDSGGGMANDDSNPTVTNCTFSGNSANYGGGGMYTWNSSSAITNCTFNGNSAEGGGGMFNGGGSLTIVNCTFSGNSADYGGGMYNSDSSPTLTNCTFSANTAVGNGGGMYNSLSDPNLTNCTFVGNSAEDGGGMYNVVSNPIVTNCTFSGNSAGWGGGMFNNMSSPTVTNCTFSGNSAEYEGGGMFNYSNSSPTLTNCTFTSNNAVDGAGMFNSESSPTLTNCTFTGNYNGEWGGGGGMANWYGSNSIVTNCTFSGNSAGEDGGGMHNINSSPTVTNCTFTGNSVGANVIFGGGGLFNLDNSSPTLTNCTFSGNTTDANGGGMVDVNSSTSVTNCILWGNTASDGNEIALVNSSTIDVNYCDVQGGQTDIYNDGTGTVNWGSGNIDADPLFIGPNGLDGIGGTADDEEYIVHLSPTGSPCFNAGDPGGDYSGQTDIDNQPRVAYGRVDMGADEVYPIFGDSEPDGDVDFYDFGYFANNWLVGVE